MRILLNLKYEFVFLCVIFIASKAFQTLWIRLAAPISTYSAKVGDPVHAVLTQDLVCDDQIVLPMGTTIEGIVRNMRKVGWGIRHETAALELDFRTRPEHKEREGVADTWKVRLQRNYDRNRRPWRRAITGPIRPLIRALGKPMYRKMLRKGVISRAEFDELTDPNAKTP